MLNGISPLLSPDLLAMLCRMGHGDEIVLADAHFPGERLGPPVLRADGIRIADLLGGIAPLMPLDAYVSQPLIMMSAVEGDVLEPRIQEDYLAAIRAFQPKVADPERLDRFAFYERAKSAFAVVITGETAKYGNIILKKGVVSA